MSVRNEFLNLGSYLFRLDGDALAVEMDFIAVILGMVFDGRVQVVHRNVLRFHEFKRNGIPRGDAFV